MRAVLGLVSPEISTLDTHLVDVIAENNIQTVVPERDAQMPPFDFFVFYSVQFPACQHRNSHAAHH